MTLFTEPQLSFKYFKACSKSGIVLGRKGISLGVKIINNFTDKDIEVNQTVENIQLKENT